MRFAKVLFFVLLLVHPLVSVAFAEEDEAKEEEAVVLKKGDFSLTLSGTVEVEASYSYTFAKGTTGEGVADIVLATAQLGLEALYKERLEACIILLWEEDDTEPVDVDEGWAKFKLDDFFVGGGKTYTPFGSFDTSFVSDPLTLELAETRESVFFAGYEKDTFSFTVHLFNGDLFKSGTHPERANCLAVAFDLSPSNAVSMRLSFQSNIAESDGLLAGALSFDPQFTERVGGIHFSVSLDFGKVKSVMEVVIAERRFDVADLDVNGDGEGDRPSAWNTEAAYSFNRRSGEWTVALKLEGTDELDAPKFQEGLCVSFSPDGHTSISFEFLYRSFDEEFSAPSRDGYSVTLQVAFSF